MSLSGLHSGSYQGSVILLPSVQSSREHSHSEHSHSEHSHRTQPGEPGARPRLQVPAHTCPARSPRYSPSGGPSPGSSLVVGSGLHKTKGDRDSRKWTAGVLCYLSQLLQISLVLRVYKIVSLITNRFTLETLFRGASSFLDLKSAFASVFECGLIRHFSVIRDDFSVSLS